MTWNYRIVRRYRKADMDAEYYTDSWLMLTEVYYNNEGEPHSYAENANALNTSDDPEDLEDMKNNLILMLEAFDKSVLDEKEINADKEDS